MKKRSIAPIPWSLFGAGGMLSALIGPALVFVTGIAVPLCFLIAKDAMSYSRMVHFAGHWAGRAFLLAVVALFLFHAVHRIFHSLHDLGVRTGLVAATLCYGGALAGSAMALVALLSL